MKSPDPDHLSASVSTPLRDDAFLLSDDQKIDLIEGLVMKRDNAKLEVATGEKNNWRSQIKCRKPEKNYRY